MRMRNPKDKNILISMCDYYYQNNFDNNNKIYLEVGMGKGDFILNMALNNPNINFIGVEKYSSVASVAIKKINIYKPSNLKILIGDITNYQEILNNMVDTIFLNFSDPWPKRRHEDRRLTSRNFLVIYDSLFKGKGHIIQKTDNDDLFEYSINSYKEYGYKIKDISLDLHNSNIINVMTEYEKKFSKKGIKIKYIEVEK